MAKAKFERSKPHILFMCFILKTCMFNAFRNKDFEQLVVL